MPTVRERTTWASVLHLGVLAGLYVVVSYATGSGRSAMFFAPAIYLVWSIGSRYILPRAHRRGVQLTRQRRWPEAQSQFESSYDFFSRHAWIDQFRFLTMLSASRVSYREMALLNIATCQLQQKQVAEAKATYRLILEEFPGSPMAESALETIETVEASAASPAEHG